MSSEQIEDIQKRLEAIEKELADSDESKQDELNELYNKFKKEYPKIFRPDDDCPPVPPTQQPDAPPLPDSCEVKEGGWGAGTDPHKWKSTQMKDDPNLWKVIDDKSKNVCHKCASQKDADQYIAHYTYSVDNPPPVEPDKPTEPDQPSGELGIPVPTGFTIKPPVTKNFKWWGRHETNYNSGGAGPSERWDCKDLPNALNVLAGYEFQIGPEHGKRGDDNVDLKFRGSNHSDENGGWYIPFIEWNVDGSPAGAGIGKEYPHPSTTHSDFNTKGQGTKVENIKDGKKHGFLAACFNDKGGVPTVYLWYAANPDGKFSSYKLLGVSKDTGNMKPGPVCTKIGMKGSSNQSLQIRMDEVPNAKVFNTFAVELATTPE